MKRVLSLILAVFVAITALCTISVNADISFSDLDQSHWAYNDIFELVSKGTINGYKDGRFLPEGTITRAEFIKMLGKTENRNSEEFYDVPQDHWAYEYIMFSGITTPDNSFRPDDNITRYEVADILYKRFGGGIKSVAPLYITGDTNRDAVAWVYNTRLMIGDDKIHLRLSDTLTRAEAATLIVRAQKLTPDAEEDFISVFSDDTYENVYNGSMLFDSAYSSDEKISNGEVALAALRFEFRDVQPPLGNYYFSSKFDNEYSKHWSIMTKYVFDDTKYKCTEEECIKNATVSDAISMLGYCLKTNNYINVTPEISGNLYKDIDTDDLSNSERKALEFMHECGISLYANDKINPDKEITKKELACIIMQLDQMLSANVAYRCGYDSAYVVTPIQTDVSLYPANASDYAAVLANVPLNVYTSEFKDPGSGKCIDYAKESKNLGDLYVKQFISLTFNMYQNDITAYITMYPTLVSKSDIGYTFRVRIDVEDAPAGTKLSDLIRLNDDITDFEVNNGMSFYVDISSNQFLTGLTFDLSLMTVSNVIK